MVKNDIGKTAFHITCEEPIKNKYGLYFDGGTYTKYNELLNRLW